MKERMTSREFRAQHGDRKTRPWSNATPMHCFAGHKHASRLEARVCDRLATACRFRGEVLYRQVRLPLWSLAPAENGRPLTITVDFAIVKGGQLVRLFDAKGRVSRDWRRGAKACEAAYGIKVEEVNE